MWPRVVEVMLGCWLAASPFIFHPSADQPAFWWNDFLCALLIITFALLSFWERARWAHLLQLGMGLWLMGWAFYWGFGQNPVPPAMQNDVMTGFTLLMFAILPNKVTRPPASWEHLFLERYHAHQEPRAEKGTTGKPLPADPGTAR